MRTTKDRFSNIQLTLDLDTSTSPSAGILLSIHVCSEKADRLNEYTERPVSPVVIMGKSVQDFVNLYGCDSRFEKNIE